MHFLETQDGHRFPVEQLAPDLDSSTVEVWPQKKSDFEWFISHSHRFQVMVWENNVHTYTLSGCLTEFNLTEYENGKLLARVLYEELIPCKAA